jgi:signal peptidase I
MADDTPGPSTPQPTAGKKRRTLRFLRDILIIFLIAVVASVLLKTFVVRSFYIPSASMENTLQIGDRILVNELVPRFAGLERGDVVVFRDPGGWLPPSADEAPEGLGDVVHQGLVMLGLAAENSNDHLIKRAIGLPGDRVVCCDPLGQIEVNDVPLDEPYVVHSPNDPNSAAVLFDVTVPAGSLWVMGDNRFNSRDSSRNQELPGHGFVPIDNVVGKAFVITWPLGRWDFLDNYPVVFSGTGREGR